ncbi:MAG TPA: ROK family protein [candidate division Zixibacteria bacterium]|nr:ROK family protein [candidate division Zixibacteria bacterium]
MSKRAYAGIDIGGTNVKFGLIDRNGQVIHREQRPTMAEKGPVPLLHLITNIAERILYYAAEEEYTVDHVGVGSPGAVDFKTGTVIGPCPNIEGWTGTKIAETLSERINLPVYVDNDANAMALAESKFGAAIGANSVVCATVGTGIGGGIILNGKVWRGATGSAAEVGHVPISMDGPLCACGSRGCVEAYCSSRAIIERTRSKLKKNLSPVFNEILNGDIDSINIKKLFAAARKQDETALEVLSETAYYLGIGLAGVVNLLNPEIVVIGGGIADGGGGFVEMVAAVIKERAWDSATRELRVARARLGNDAGFIGAAVLGESG